jgi:hypothetical protein
MDKVALPLGIVRVTGAEVLEYRLAGFVACQRAGCVTESFRHLSDFTRD